jgi:stearoyl-CoA desaturase (Delta-9 desaturase)
MSAILFDGLLNLPWWGVVLACLVMVQITIAAVTIYLHRCQAHRALDLHPIPSHFFRLWLWLTTGMVTKEWTAIHRKHHAKCETADDPHSPVAHGLSKVVFKGVLLYVNESKNDQTMKQYGHGTPDDWLENKVYTPLQKYGILIMAMIDIALFGAIPGLLVFGIQMGWIPFWAAGVINGIGHAWGYRNFGSEDASTNITPWAFWIGGEELHNNHHAYPTSARFSQRWYEFDLGWVYIRAMAALRLATVRRVAPKLKFTAPKDVADDKTLEAIITHRYEVMARFAKSLRETSKAEVARLIETHGKRSASLNISGRRVRRWMMTDSRLLSNEKRAALQQALDRSQVLAKADALKSELASLWERSTLTTEQLVQKLNAWCAKAEQSGIPQLAMFSKQLRSFA